MRRTPFYRRAFGGIGHRRRGLGLWLCLGGGLRARSLRPFPDAIPVIEWPRASSASIDAHRRIVPTRPAGWSAEVESECVRMLPLDLAQLNGLPGSGVLVPDPRYRRKEAEVSREDFAGIWTRLIGGKSATRCFL